MSQIEIHGLAIRFGQFGRATELCHPMAARRGCISLARPTALRLGHDESRNYATTLNGSMRVWVDTIGVFFAAWLPVTRVNAWLERMVRNGTLRGASVRFSADRESIVTDWGEEVIWSALPEISITDDPAQDGTAVWIGDEPVDALPAGVRAARALWQGSRMALDRPRPAPRIAASARRLGPHPSAAVMAQIRQLVADGPPTGWVPPGLTGR